MGVTIETITPGDGNKPKKGQTACVHYVGTFTDGKKFDSSRDRNRPFEFEVGGGHVIAGWDEAIKQLSVGEKAKVTCTHEVAYGVKGYPGVIPPKATLVFDMELISIK